jgi:hypothetical protein
MLKFTALSASQKKCVIALIEHTPALKQTGRITLKEVVAITQDLASQRDAGGVKIGYPNWLFKSNKVEKGIYQLPLPTEHDLSDYAKASVKPAKVNKVAKALAKVKAVKAATTKKSIVSDKADISGSRLSRIIEESSYVDDDVEDFNQILRENGIEV